MKATKIITCTPFWSPERLSVFCRHLSPTNCKKKFFFHSLCSLFLTISACKQEASRIFPVPWDAIASPHKMYVPGRFKGQVFVYGVVVSLFVLIALPLRRNTTLDIWPLDICQQIWPWLIGKQLIQGWIDLNYTVDNDLLHSKLIAIITPRKVCYGVSLELPERSACYF